MKNNTVERTALIAAGVKNLQEFGYPSCNKDNILTDYVFSRFFLSMLKENKGHGKAVDAAIDELIVQCEPKDKKDVRGNPGKSKSSKVNTRSCH